MSAIIFLSKDERNDYMSGFQCPYCSMIMPISDDTYVSRETGFESINGEVWLQSGPKPSSSCLRITFYKCPNCNEYSIECHGRGDAVKDVKMHIRPRSTAKQFPDYIPKSIRNDYEEACAIVFLSPKASATLSRRCLQGMIRDFWGISKSTLNQEIDALKNNIPADLWSAINSLRQLGNIGAHMEKDTNVIIDIDPDEAESLIKLIELLMKEWYINREERKQLFSTIISTNDQKQNQRKKI